MYFHIYLFLIYFNESDQGSDLGFYRMLCEDEASNLSELTPYEI